MVTQYRPADHAAHGRRRAERQGRVLTGRGASPRLAITTDWLTTFGGGERVLAELHALYPEAPIYTSVYDPSGLPAEIRTWDVRPSFLQRFPFAKRYSRLMLPLMPRAFERLDLSGYDVVLTMSSAFSKNVARRDGMRNLCYCLTPPRYLWDLKEAYLGGMTALAAPAVQWLRDADLRAAERVDEFVAISRTVAERVQRTYGRDASVVFPPVDTKRVQPNGLPAEDFFLVVSRLVPYKRIDLAIEACNRLGRRLVVVGSGPDARRLKTLAGPTITFAGSLSDEAITDLYARCRAFVFPGLEDFGITPVEAQAAGRPVVAFGVGGAAETVIDGETGVLFREQTVDALVEAIGRLERTPIDADRCRANAERFDSAVFREGILALIARP